MSVKIIDTDTCSVCRNKVCCYSDARTKEIFHGIRSETTVCPVGVLSEGPLEIAEQRDGQWYFNDSKCINCGLCELNCGFYRNLSTEGLDYTEDSFANITEKQANAIACSYLHFIVGFTANTNRHNALQFDGYACHDNGEEAFVEVSKGSDSLESVRRLLGDSLIYSPSGHRITTGIIVLQEMPRVGSRNIFEVLEKMKSFPTTGNICVYLTTFKLLRFLALHFQHAEFTFDQFLFDPMNETPDQYVSKVCSLNQNIDESILRQLL